MKHPGIWKKGLFAAGAVLAAGGAIWAARASGTPSRALELVAASGPLAPLVFWAVFTAACVFMLPTFYLTIGAGFLFGPVWGFLVASLSVISGAGAAFLAARAGSGRAGKKILASPGFAALREAVDAGGWKIVFLCRLSPVLPFNILNYAFGLTGIPFSRYFFATWAGSIPWTAMYVHAGSLAANLSGLAALPSAPSGGWAKTAYWAGAAATAGATVMAGRIARKTLIKRLKSDKPGDGSEN